MIDPEFLGGVPAAHVLQRLTEAEGDELASGKLHSPESSAALAVNCFGWFIPRPEQLPALPALETVGMPEIVDVEFCARFPWSGGKHPWLDAMAQTPTHLVGIESKRFEPFRDRKTVSFSEAYERDVWGPDMAGYTRMRERLQAGETAYHYLDATQLIKHAFGLVTTARRRNLTPALFYIFAEPAERDGKPIATAALERHRAEVRHFADEIAGNEVAFGFSSYRDWLRSWDGDIPSLSAHRAAVLERFAP